MNKFTTQAEIKSIADATEGRGTVMRVRLSRTSVDRDMQTIRADGWSVPTGTVNVLVDHKNSIESVVGKLTRTWTEGDDFMGEIEYADNVAENSLAKLVVAMHKAGQLGPVSVGFIPVQWKTPDGKTYTRENPGPSWDPGITFEKQELIELSEVAVGSHRDAMVLAMRAFGMEREVAPSVDLGTTTTWSIPSVWINSDTTTGTLRAMGASTAPGQQPTTPPAVPTKAPTSGDWFQKTFGLHATPDAKSSATPSRVDVEGITRAKASLASVMADLDAILLSAERADAQDAA